LLSPIIPGLSNAIYQQLGYQVDFNQKDTGTVVPFAVHSQWGILSPGQELGAAQPIFQRLELPENAV
jgi:methionyl-tRNA synthetase